MADTAADVLVDTIYDWGVEVVFGLPGDGINGIMESLRQRRDKIWRLGIGDWRSHTGPKLQSSGE